ncbi:MAG: hypothetical protein RM368_29940 [Nostoc sp. DedSLP03]|uniref:hypothetical protein n=1 Tax=Nostoc sp. DedSLP03 TaxID=3075400 RepID=UPI002AD34CEA|nr:hypothetical protein [Nostoc sp. DedSLP03]MDZ7969124.1 hypothetical protein [Nostoc sp. DedSLP03]
MSRRILTKQLESIVPGTQIDTYFDKVIKYIPADIVGAWVTVTGLIKSGGDVPTTMLLWIAFILGIVLTAVWTVKQTSVKNKPPAITQTVVSTGAFIVWVFALGGPFVTLGFYRPLYGSLLLILYTLIVALIDPPED